MNENPTIWGTEIKVHLVIPQIVGFSEAFVLGIPQIVGFQESSPHCRIFMLDNKLQPGEHTRL